MAVAAAAPCPTSWTCERNDLTYVCSTDPSMLDLEALHKAMDSDMMWWAKGLVGQSQATMVNNSLLFGLYLQDPANAPDHDVDETKAYAMIGCARVITDRVTLGYLTDVYVLPAHQRRGLGTFMMTCVNEVLEGWPDLRGFWILSSSPEAQRMYEKVFGTVDFFAENKKPHLRLLQKKGPSSSH